MSRSKPIINLDAIDLNSLTLDDDEKVYAESFLQNKILSNSLLRKCGFRELPEYRIGITAKEKYYKERRLRLYLTKMAIENYIRETDEMIQFIEEYKENSNLREIIEDFIDDAFVNSEDPNEKISLDILYESYRYFSRQNSDEKIRNKNDIKKILIKMNIYDTETNNIIGYKFRVHDNNEFDDL